MQKQKLPVAVLNIGGVANINYIDEANKIVAFDTGPGNALIDDAMNIYFNKSYDKNGKIASNGRVDHLVASEFLVNEYFKQPYPKSLDRNSFEYVKGILANHSPEDIIATLTYITCATIVRAIEMLPNIPGSIFLCGGGSKNTQIVNWLKLGLLENGVNSIVENNFYEGDQEGKKV